MKLKIDATCVSSGHAQRTPVISLVRRTPCIPIQLACRNGETSSIARSDMRRLDRGPDGSACTTESRVQCRCARACLVSIFCRRGRSTSWTCQQLDPSGDALLRHVLKPDMSLVQGLGLDMHTEAVMDSLGLLKVLLQALQIIMQALKPWQGTRRAAGAA